MQNAMNVRALMGAAALLVLPAGASAQTAERHLSLEGRAGVGVASGTFGDVTQPGPAVGGTLLWHFHRNFALRGDLEYVMLKEDRNASGLLLGSPVNVLHIGGAFEADFSPPEYQEVPIMFAVHLGAGATRFDADDDFVPGASFGAFEGTYFSVYGGVNLGYRFAPWLTGFMSGQTWLSLADEADTAVYLNATEGVGSFNTIWSFPLSLGVRATL